MSKAQQMIDDPRPIKAIHWDDKDQTAIIVGEARVTAIEAYGEPGPHCELPWLAVYVSGEIRWRVPADQVAIKYEDKK